VGATCPPLMRLCTSEPRPRSFPDATQVGARAGHRGEAPPAHALAPQLWCARLLLTRLTAPPHLRPLARFLTPERALAPLSEPEPPAASPAGGASARSAGETSTAYSAVQPYDIFASGRGGNSPELVMEDAEEDATGNVFSTRRPSSEEGGDEKEAAGGAYGSARHTRLLFRRSSSQGVGTSGRVSTGRSSSMRGSSGRSDASSVYAVPADQEGTFRVRQLSTKAEAQVEEEARPSSSRDSGSASAAVLPPATVVLTEVATVVAPVGSERPTDFRSPTFLDLTSAAPVAAAAGPSDGQRLAKSKQAWASGLIDLGQRMRLRRSGISADALNLSSSSEAASPTRSDVAVRAPHACILRSTCASSDHPPWVPLGPRHLITARLRRPPASVGGGRHSVRAAICSGALPLACAGGLRRPARLV
jgi:hypothetical protein